MKKYSFLNEMFGGIAPMPTVKHMIGENPSATKDVISDVVKAVDEKVKKPLVKKIIKKLTPVSRKITLPSGKVMRVASRSNPSSRHKFMLATKVATHPASRILLGTYALATSTLPSGSLYTGAIAALPPKVSTKVIHSMVYDITHTPQITADAVNNTVLYYATKYPKITNILQKLGDNLGPISTKIIGG